MNRYVSSTLLVAMALPLILSFQNCSKVDFKHVEPTEVASKGEPVPADVTTTLFEVPLVGRKKVDMLVVVDNSVSMEEEQAEMATRFPGFISKLSNLDWRLAITTTQSDSDSKADLSNCGSNEAAGLPGRDGCIHPFSSQYEWLDSSMNPSLTDSLFRNTVQMPPDDTYTDERGIHTAYRFLQRHQSGQQQFFRQDSHVVMIIISDEDERSIGNHPENENPLLETDQPEFLVDKFHSILNPASFTAHGIITRPGDAECWLNLNGRWPGNVYEELIERSGGVVGDICANNYGSQLDAISKVIQESVNSIALDCAPIGNVTVSMTKDSPTVGSAGSDYVEVKDLDVSVQGSELRFGSALNPGDKLKLDYTCAPDKGSN